MKVLGPHKNRLMPVEKGVSTRSSQNSHLSGLFSVLSGQANEIKLPALEPAKQWQNNFNLWFYILCI